MSYLLRFFLVSAMGILEYMLEISRDANVVVGVIGDFDSWLMRSVEFVILKALGSGVKRLMFWVKDLESL